MNPQMQEILALVAVIAVIVWRLWRRRHASSQSGCHDCTSGCHGANQAEGVSPAGKDKISEAPIAWSPRRQRRGR